MIESARQLFVNRFRRSLHVPIPPDHPHNEATSGNPVQPKAENGNAGIEIIDAESLQWESARIANNDRDTREYVVSLTLQDDPTKSVLGVIQTDVWGYRLNVPITDYTPKEELAYDAYVSATFFGKVDEEDFAAYATDDSQRGPLLALVNRESAGVGNEEAKDWFYTTFDLEHEMTYNDALRLSSFSVTYDNQDSTDITFSSLGRKAGYPIDEESDEESARKARLFAQELNGTFSHLSVAPVGVDMYLQSVKDTLRFAPEDWEV